MEKRLYEKQEIYDPATIAELSEHYAAILRLLGEDPTREGLLKTPERVAKAMAFMTKGYAEDPRDILLSAMFREEYRQMVLVRDIEVYSLCEHHMLPFDGKAHAADIPDGYIDDGVVEGGARGGVFRTPPASTGAADGADPRLHP